MSKLTQLLGNRELAWKDGLEKGRVWVYSDGNMYSGFCNGFCWKPPGCGLVTIEIWGAAGSGAEMCCCGAGLPGNPPAYVKKCLCVCPANHIRGSVGRSCNNADDLCFRGCSEATCVCWYGCAPKPVFNDGFMRCDQDSWKANNPWGWGNTANGLETITNQGIPRVQGGFWQHRDGPNDYCAAAGATEGCLCAQGGRGGNSFCMDTKSPYSCFLTGYFCGNRVGPGHNMCDTGNSACGRVCNWCQGPGFVACAFGGDINCCGGFSCVDFLGCLQTCPCQTLHHIRTAPGVFASEGATISFYADGDTPQFAWAGAGHNLLNAITAASRSPSHNMYAACWVGARSCGCYNMNGCMHVVPYGVPGSPPFPCPGVRDHAMRGGMGMVRITYRPTDGGTTY